MNIGLWVSQIREAYPPYRILVNVTGGFVAGLLEITFSISFAALIFSGTLSPYLSAGIGLSLFSMMILAAVVALLSSLHGSVAGPQDSASVILALVATAIVTNMPVTATANETFLAVIAALSLTTLFTGALFIMLGSFNLGRLIRFIPYPVVGGYLAGTGWLLVRGAVSVMTDQPVTIANIPFLLQPDMLLRWLPGAVFALVIVFALERYRHFLVMPALIAGGLGLFYLTLWLTGTSVAETSARGWLLGPFPEGGLWQPLSLSDLAQVRWSFVFGQSGNIATILFVSTISLLLNASGLELATNRDIDLNRELRATGLANLIAGLGGGLPGYTFLSTTTLVYRMGANGRLVGLIVALSAGLILWLGTPLLSVMSKVLLGGLLFFLGLDFLVDWVYRAWKRFSWLDNLLITAILVVIAAVGFLQGVLLGILLAAVLFVINYSRINVVKHELSGTYYRSRVTRCHPHRSILQQQGDQILLLKLQGYLFFGTVHALVDLVRLRLKAPDQPNIRFMVFDFRQVTGLDATAMQSFRLLKQLAQTNQINLVFTNLLRQRTPAGQQDLFIKHLTRLGEEETTGSERTIRIFHDLDHGLQWCEDQILISAGMDPQDDGDGFLTQLSAIIPENTNVRQLATYFERLEVGSGFVLMKKDDPAVDLFMIESGELTAKLDSAEGDSVRLETMRGGRVVGEIGFYLDHPRTADVVANEPSVIYRLSKESLQRMEQDDPELASALHQGIILLTSERITHLITTINALQH